jgi:hypothetical protein
MKKKPRTLWTSRHGWTEATVPNYVSKLERLIASGELKVTPGVTYENQIRHDDWCAMLVQGGVCDCDPEFTLVPIKAV